MKRKVTLQQVYVFNEAAKSFRYLTGDAGFAIAKTLVNLQNDLSVFDAGRMALVKKYSDDGESVTPKSKRYSEFVPEYLKLLSREVEVDIEELQEGTTIDDLRCRDAKMEDYGVVMDFLIAKKEDNKTGGEEENV